MVKHNLNVNNMSTFSLINKYYSKNQREGDGYGQGYNFSETGADGIHLCFV